MFNIYFRVSQSTLPHFAWYEWVVGVHLRAYSEFVALIVPSLSGDFYPGRHNNLCLP